MKRNLLFATLIFTVFTLSYSQKSNLLKSGNFKTLKHWTPNQQLSENGKTTLLPDDNGVRIYNPVIDLDGSLYQDIPVNNQEWYSYSLRIKGEGMMRASAAFISMDRQGKVLNIITPTRVQGTSWRDFSGTFRVPAGTKSLRTLLSVLDGNASFADISLSASKEPQRIVPRVNAGSMDSDKGFSVESFSIDRPFWELFSDDLNGDGIPELIGCDVDGIVTVRNPGSPPFFTYAPGAMVYQFEAADLNNDGQKEILMSLVDPKFKVKAIDLKGNTLIEFPGPSSHERITTGDMDGDGFPEIAVSKNNGVAGSGLAGGLVIYNNKGEILWEKEELMREFVIADILPEPGWELIVGGSGISFRVYNKEGRLLKNLNFSGELLDHFRVADVNQDGQHEIIASYNSGSRMTVICSDGDKLMWESVTPVLLGGGMNAGMNMAIGDFDKSIPGLETAMIGTHSLFLLDSQGALVYQNREEGPVKYWESWADRGINSLDIACWNENDPHLYLSSSRFRHRAYHSLTYKGKDELGTYQLPDQEKHLEDIYYTLKKQPQQRASGKEKIKVFMAMNSFAQANEETLLRYRKKLDELETDQIEYLVMFEASDLYGHERGYKLTTDQIVERSALFEKTGIPFGYFVAHGGQVWTTEEAIRRSKQVAPGMFRFLYIAENLETLYSPLYKDVLAWSAKMLEFCSQNDMKMIFKEKHDVWGLLPSDPEVSDILFHEKYKATTVPIWSTNQPYQPEIQMGGMLGLKLAGLCNEWGMSTQYWNWHEWGRYPRGIRDVSATYVCPSDVILRLDLMGIALGGTWIHIEGGQTYLESDVTSGLAPPAIRHRDLAYELIRKNIITPGANPVNVNNTVVLRTFHSELEKGKLNRRRIAYPYYDRNTEPLRQGFIPARYLFETYSPDAFPWIAYSMAWNSITCFPQTPYGWIPFLPPDAPLLPAMQPVYTDGEKVKLGNEWVGSLKAAPYITEQIKQGATDIPFEAPGTCLIIKKDPRKNHVYTLIMMDTGYLAPTGVETVIKATNRRILVASDMVSGNSVDFSGNSCAVKIEPGAFRVIRIELGE